MPGMKLDFLKNPHQRVATGKSLPLKQVEAIVLYGRPEQRAKVVEKLLPSSYGLALNKTTHHILLTLLDHTDNMARVKMLYSVRTKILDLSRSPAGSTVVQKLIDKVPSRQRREIAQAFILNVEPDEFRNLCQHPFGNHVAQKLLEYPECAEVVCPEGLAPHLNELALHPYSQRVVAKYVDHVRGGWLRTLKALFPNTPFDNMKDDDDASPDDLPEPEAFQTEEVSAEIDKGVSRLFNVKSETMVLSALLKNLLVPTAVKDAIVAHLSEYAADYLNPQTDKGDALQTAGTEKEEEDSTFDLPDFGSAAAAAPKPANSPATAATSTSPAPRHIHVFCSVFQEGDDIQRKDLWDTIASDAKLVNHLVANRATVPVAIAAVKFVETSRPALYTALFHAATGKKSLTVSAVAEDPVRTLLLRAFIENDMPRLSVAQRSELCKEAVRLAQSPTASPVLQKALEAAGAHEFAGQMYKSVRKSLGELVSHPSGSYLVQALLQFSSEEQREKLSKDLWTIIGKNMRETLSYSQGSHAMQKLLAYASDDTVKAVVQQLVGDAHAEAEEVADRGSDDEGSDDDEVSDNEDGGAEESAKKPISRKEQRAINKSKHYGVRSNAVVDYALHNRACFVIQALLRETRSRQLDEQRKALMDELKPHVFDLSVSPWAGSVVLDAMMQSGSAQLADAMKNVVFLKAEAWLSDVSDAKKQRGAGIDATTRETLKRQRELNSSSDGAKEKEVSGDNRRRPARRVRS